jgi:hypothetical protein
MLVFDFDLIQQEFENNGFSDVFRKLRLKLLLVCERDIEDYINLFLLADALVILKGRNWVDFSFEDLVDAIEEVEKNQMEHEDFFRGANIH